MSQPFVGLGKKPRPDKNRIIRAQNWGNGWVRAGRRLEKIGFERL